MYDENKIMLFRVADYDESCGKLINISFYDTESSGPKIIGARPSELRSNMAILREWKYDGDKTISFAYNYNYNIFEIVEPPELYGIEYSDSKAIRSALYRGLTLDENVSENLLIVIGQASTHKAVLFCRKNDLIKLDNQTYAVPTNTQDMLHSLHFLDEYDILSDDIVNTESSNISLPNGRKAPARKFYNALKLPEKVATLNLFGIEKYIPQYISSYLKKNKAILDFSAKDKKKIVDAVELILNDQKSLQEYFAPTCFNTEDLTSQISSYSNQIVSGILNDSEADQLISACLLDSNEIMSRCLEIVKRRWLEESDAERQAILEELAELQEHRATADSELKEIMSQKEKAETQIEELNKKIQEKEKEYEKVQEDIQSELKAFSNNIVHSTAICSLIGAIGANTSDNYCNAVVQAYTPNYIIQDENPDEADDFQDYLADNLVQVGYDDKTAMEISQLLTHTIATRTPIILSNNENRISSCVAAMFATSYSEIIIFPDTDLTALFKKIQSISVSEVTTVLLIKGAFSGFSSQHFEAFCGYANDKNIILLFAAGETAPELLPKSALEKCFYLDCDQGLSFAESVCLKGFASNIATISRDYSVDEINDEKSRLKEFINAGIIGNQAANHLAKFMVDITCNIKKDWILLQQLCVFARIENKSDDISAIFEENSISLPQLKKYM